MAANSKMMKERRAKLISSAREIYDRHADRDGNLGAEHQAQYDRLFAEVDQLASKIKVLDASESSWDGPAGLGHSSYHDPSGIQIRTYHAGNGPARYETVRPGKRGSQHYREMFAKALGTQSASLPTDVYQALQSDNAEQAGYLVASEQFAAEMLREVDDLLFIRQYAKVHTVREASSLGIRKRTARMSTFGWSAEIQAPTADTALKFGKRSLTPHYLAGEIVVSNDLLRRSMAGAEAIVREEMARDAGENMEDAFLTGDGHNKPLGVFTASDDGISTARDVSEGNTTTALSADGLINCKYAMKSQYRNQLLGPVRWLFHRDAVKQIAKLKDGEGNYLYQLAESVDGQDMLLGYPIDESERAPNTFTTGQYVGLLANWRFYEIADALDMEIKRLVELYALTNQIGFIGRLKTDGMPTLEEAFVRVTLA